MDRRSLLAALPFLQTGWDAFKRRRCPPPFAYQGDPARDMLHMHLRHWAETNRTQVTTAAVVLRADHLRLIPAMGAFAAHGVDFAFPPGVAMPVAEGVPSWLIVSECPDEM